MPRSFLVKSKQRCSYHPYQLKKTNTNYLAQENVESSLEIHTEQKNIIDDDKKEVLNGYYPFYDKSHENTVLKPSPATLYDTSIVLKPSPFTTYPSTMQTRFLQEPVYEKEIIKRDNTMTNQNSVVYLTNQPNTMISTEKVTTKNQNKNPRHFSCKYCDKDYMSLGALKMHIRTHTLPCQCYICGKSFSRPWLLQGHIRTHTGERPFGCSYCGRAFADRSNLRAHIQTHAEVKKYECKRCSKTFSRSTLLKKHEAQDCFPFVERKGA